MKDCFLSHSRKLSKVHNKSCLQIAVCHFPSSGLLKGSAWNGQIRTTNCVHELLCTALAEWHMPIETCCHGECSIQYSFQLQNTEPWAQMNCSVIWRILPYSSKCFPMQSMVQVSIDSTDVLILTTPHTSNHWCKWILTRPECTAGPLSGTLTKSHLPSPQHKKKGCFRRTSPGPVFVMWCGMWLNERVFISHLWHTCRPTHHALTYVFHAKSTSFSEGKPCFKLF